MAMKVDKILHMNEGFGENSYARNSLIQKSIIMKANSKMEESITKLYQTLRPESLRIADFGCSSGPNSLMVVSNIINALDKERQIFNLKAPQIEVYLNDLPGNDFNAIFSLLSSFYQKLEEERGSDFGPCFVSGTPRSFYGQCFPDHFLHFVHSSNSLHWLSQVPAGLTSDNGEALNKGTIYLAKSSLPEIAQAYYAQFKNDFMLFLRSRAKEMVHGGHIFLTLHGSKHRFAPHPNWEALDSALHHMISEGVIDKEQLDGFNMPFYAPTLEEIRELVEAQGSFSITRLETFVADYMSISGTSQTLDTTAELASKIIRAGTESLFSTTFSETIIDDLFLKYKNSFKESLTQGLVRNSLHIMVSLIKRQ